MVDHHDESPEDGHHKTTRRNMRKNISFATYTLFYMLFGTVIYAVFFIILQFITYRKDLRQAKISVFEPRVDVPSITYDFWITAFAIGFFVYLNTVEAARIGFVKHVRYPTWKRMYGCLKFFRILHVANDEKWTIRIPKQIVRATFVGLFWCATFGSLSVACMYWALESGDRGRSHWVYADLEWIKGWDAAAGTIFLFCPILYVTAFTLEQVDPTPAFVHKRPRGMHHHENQKRNHDCDHSSDDSSGPHTAPATAPTGILPIDHRAVDV